MGACIAMKKEYMIYIAVAVIVIIGVAVYLLSTNHSNGCSECGKQVSSMYIKKLSGIANNYTLADQIGAGVVVLSGKYANPPKFINAKPLSVDGKPEVLYVGGEFCPYCATSRWGLIIALMRFGNFTGLTYMESSPTDYAADTATFSFVNSSYRSNILYFNGVELFDRYEKNLTTTNFSPSEQLVYSKYSINGIPFMDFENGSVLSGASISPLILQGYDWNRILENLTNQNSVIAQSIIGNANVYTAYICESNQTLNATAAACKQSYVKAIIG